MVITLVLKVADYAPEPSMAQKAAGERLLRAATDKNLTIYQCENLYSITGEMSMDECQEFLDHGNGLIWALYGPAAFRDAQSVIAKCQEKARKASHGQ